MWMDETTAEECRRSKGRSADRGGERSRARAPRALHRPADPQVLPRQPDAYDATTRIHLVSSFLASLLRRRRRADRSRRRLRHEPDGPATRRVVARGARCDGAGPGRRLPPIRAVVEIVGRLAPVLAAPLRVSRGGDRRVDRRQPLEPDRHRHDRRGVVAVSLGTSDTVLAWTPNRRPSRRTCSDRRPATS